MMIQKPRRDSKPLTAGLALLQNCESPFRCGKASKITSCLRERNDDSKGSIVLERVKTQLSGIKVTDDH